jgi:hypothetical protein
MSHAYKLVLRVPALVIVLGLNAIVLRGVPYAPALAAGGLALFLLTYLPLARRFTTSRARRWLSVGLLIAGFTVVVAISVYRVKYSIAAGAGGVGVVVGCVALFPLGDDRRRDRQGPVG